jgi:DNA end-binding protein Ku
MHALWSGSISFGLINIPITLYSATKDRPLDFDMLRKDDLCPISFVRVCRATGEEVPFSQIVKGYEYKEGDYVVLDKEDFKRAAAKKSDTIDIEEFVDEKEIDSLYYEKPYYLEPGKGADKAYVLLREALRQANKVAIATFVFRTKEDLVALKVYNDMAVKLVEQLEGKFKPEDFKDTYTNDLMKVIRAKAKGKKLTPLPKEKTAKAPDPTDLVEQLKASLEAGHASA